MRILLLGSTGQLGSELQRNLYSIGEVYCPRRQDVDLMNFQDLTNVIIQFRPQIIINAAAYTDVDQAELKPEIAMRANGLAVGVIMEAAAKVRASFLHFSSDYVFDGEKKFPYTELDIPNPINVYGKTKLVGETIAKQIGGSYIIFRTSWLYSLERKNFVTELLSKARRKDVIWVVKDQIGSPTWTQWIANISCQLLNNASDNIYDFFQQRSGVYHLANRGSVSRFEWARVILESYPHRELHLYKSLKPALSGDFKGLASRPSYSALDSSLFEKVFNMVVPYWKKTLKACFLKYDQEINKNDYNLIK